MNRGFIAGALLALVLGLAIAPAAAKDKVKRDAAYYQWAFKKWTSETVRLEKADPKRAASENLAQVRNLIGQCQAFVASDKIEEVHDLEARVTLRLRLAALQIDRAGLQEQADNAETEAHKAEEAAQKIKDAADALEKRYSELEEKGL